MPSLLRVHGKRRFATMDDFQFTADVLQSASVPATAALPGGGFVVVWMKSTGAIITITGQRYDQNGRPVGSEFAISPAAFENHTPDVATLSSGGFAVSWTSNGNIEARVYNAGGEPVGAPFAVNATPSGVQTTSQVAALAGGGFVITWHNTTNGTFDNIRGQVFTAQGTKIGGEFIAGDAVPGTEGNPEVLALSGGGFVIAWDQPLADDSHIGARAQVFDSAGAKVGPAFLINTITAGWQSGPKLIALPSGGFLAIWGDDGDTLSGNPDNGNQGAWAQRFDASGNKVGEDVQLYAGHGVQDVEVIPGIGFAAVWKDGDAASATFGRLRVQIFDFELNRTGDEFSVQPYLDSIQNLPHLTVLDNGGLMVSWLDWVPLAGQEMPRSTIFFATTRGTAQADIITGTANRDFLVGLGGPDRLSGGGDDDGLDGNEGDDVLDGGAGDDSLVGGSGNDVLFGGDGDDMLVGGNGQDWLESGSQSLTGGDIYRFESASDTRGYVLRSDGKQLKPDVIADFFHPLDKIDLSAIDANTNTAGDDAFRFINGDAFTNQAGQLRCVTANGVTSVFGDVNGDGVADLHILVLIPFPLIDADFIL